MADKRRFTRLSSDLIVKIKGRRPSDSDTRIRAQSRITNISRGGVFVESPAPFEVGTIVELDFTIPRHAEPVHARGVVRWNGTAEGRRGMGIEFLEVTIPSSEAIRRYIDDQLKEPGLVSLVATELRRNLLKLHVRKVGQSFTVEVLAQFFTASQEELVEALAEFEKWGLVKASGETVSFSPGTDESLRQQIADWVAANRTEEE